MLSHRSMGWYSAIEGPSDSEDDDWHDALSEVDLAEALEEWEEEQQWHDPEVDQAIQVLKAHGRLLPEELEAEADAQRRADMAAAYEGAPRVHVSALPPDVVKLELSRSQHLHSALELPAAQELLQQTAELMVNGRVLAAHARLEQLAREAGCSLEELAAWPAHLVAAALPAGTSLDIARVISDARQVRDALSELEDHSGWMVSRNDKLKVYYRHQRGTTVHSLQFSAVFEHPLEHLLALAHEFDLIVTWNKFSLASDMLAEPSIFESYLYGAQWMMRPFKPMQGLLRARGFDLAEEHQCLLVTVEDCAPEDLPVDAKPLPREWAKRKTVNFLPGSCCKLKPLPPGPDGQPRTEGSMVLHLDPHIPFIPAFLLNFVLGVLSPYVYNQMVKVLDSSFADPKGTYPQRIAAQPHLYGLVRRRLDEFSHLLAADAAAEASKAHAEAEAPGGRRRRRNRTTSSTP